MSKYAERFIFCVFLVILIKIMCIFSYLFIHFKFFYFFLIYYFISSIRSLLLLTGEDFVFLRNIKKHSSLWEYTLKSNKSYLFYHFILDLDLFIKNFLNILKKPRRFINFILIEFLLSFGYLIYNLTVLYWICRIGFKLIFHLVFNLNLTITPEKIYEPGPSISSLLYYTFVFLPKIKGFSVIYFFFCKKKKDEIKKEFFKIMDSISFTRIIGKSRFFVDLSFLAEYKINKIIETRFWKRKKARVWVNQFLELISYIWKDTLISNFLHPIKLIVGCKIIVKNNNISLNNGKLAALCVLYKTKILEPRKFNTIMKKCLVLVGGQEHQSVGFFNETEVNKFSQHNIATHAPFIKFGKNLLETIPEKNYTRFIDVETYAYKLLDSPVTKFPLKQYIFPSYIEHKLIMQTEFFKNSGLYSLFEWSQGDYKFILINAIEREIFRLNYQDSNEKKFPLQYEPFDKILATAEYKKFKESQKNIFLSNENKKIEKLLKKDDLELKNMFNYLINKADNDITAGKLLVKREDIIPYKSSSQKFYDDILEEIIIQVLDPVMKDIVDRVEFLEKCKEMVENIPTSEFLIYFDMKLNELE